MIKKLIYSILVFSIALSMIFISSCKKEIDTIGVDIVGENPLNVVIIDTITLDMHSELVDSLRTDELITHLLGAYKDPVFGISNASVYTQFRLSESTQGFDFGSNAQADSLVLYIRYKQKEVFGDSAYTQHLSVYELSEDLNRDTAYYAFQSSETFPEKVGEVTFVPSFDTVYYIANGDTLSKNRPISIQMTQAMADKMLALGSEAYIDNEAFLAAFKGLWITTDDSHLPAQGGAMMYTDFNHVETFMRLYYHNDTQDSLHYDYLVNNKTARYSSFNHYDYQDADIDFRRQVIDKETDLGAQTLYLQGMGGVRTIINVPFIDNLPDNLIVNEARLYIYNLEEENENFPPISSITMSHPIANESQTDTIWYRIPDAASGEQYFGGKYQSGSNGYNFRITQELQNMITGKLSSRMIRMKAVGSVSNPAQLIFGGTQHAGDKKIKLKLICSQIQE